MKKIVASLITALVLGSSFVSASSLNGGLSSASVFSSNDQAMLFDGQVNAVMLDNEEMKNTQGEAFLAALLIGLTISTLSWLNAPGLNEPTYQGKPPFHW